jgi:hypothetical protein
MKPNWWIAALSAVVGACAPESPAPARDAGSEASTCSQT